MHPIDEEEPEILPRAIQPEERTKDHWMKHGMDFVTEKLSQLHNTKKAKNVILFLGDGMSHATVAATRMAMGNENAKLVFEEFPFTASSMTYCNYLFWTFP